MNLIEKRLWCLIAAILAGIFSGAWAQTPLEIRQTEVKLNPSGEAVPIDDQWIGAGPLHYSSKAQSNDRPTVSNNWGWGSAPAVAPGRASRGNFGGATIFAGGWRTGVGESGTAIQTLTDGSVSAGRSGNNQPYSKDNVGNVTDDGIVSLIHPHTFDSSLKMEWAMIGAPLVNRPVSYKLGSKIEPPNKVDWHVGSTGNWTEGKLLENQENLNYWQAEPHQIYSVLSATVHWGGTGYNVGDRVSLPGAGSNEIAAVFEVLAIDGSDAVTKIEVVSPGVYIGSTSGPEGTSATVGVGNGLKLNVKKGFTNFYYSPHANVVYATQPGVIRIVWKTKEPVTDVVANSADEASFHVGGSSNYRTSIDNNFFLMEQIYVVSGAAVKPHKTIYWTEKQSKGPLVQVPNAQVNAVNIVYNSNFPERVTAEVAGFGTSLVPDPSQMLQETRTLWFEYGSLHAYNAQGRVFVEYLGAIKENGVDRVHLGHEIVDVRREAKPLDLIVDLGDAITPGGEADEDLDLYPQPVLKTTMGKPHLHDFTGMDGVRRLYAIRETENLNDALVYWMEEGEEDIRWPSVYSRYKLQWPLEASKYSHYARASEESRADAMRSAVQLPPENNPILDYQSKEELNLAAITAEQKFYVHLEAPIEEHRALIRFMGEGRIWFERVYSFLDTWVDDPTSVVHSGVSGSDWFMDASTEVASARPGHFTATATVGTRIAGPSEKKWGTVTDSDYWAGHIHTATGASYNPNAYIDPMEKGFDQANQGAIIPVNSIPGQNQLEVWWFRKSERDGFKPVYWPSVVGIYTVQWPHEASDFEPESTRNAIVMASNDGSGPLNSLQAKGNIYYENNPNNPGYNPNEEHALMIAGQAYALRDDLNIHRVNNNYSSSPYVLLEFADEDGRPEMRAFQVLREQPEMGITFDYAVEAGTILQAPMPLPLLDKPLVERDQGEPPVSLNKRVDSSTSTENAAGSITELTVLTTQDRHHFRGYSLISLQNINSDPVTSLWFYLTEVNYPTHQVTGFVSEKRPMKAGYDDNTQPDAINQRRYTLASAADFAVNDKVALISSAGKAYWVATVIAKDAEQQTVDVEFLTHSAPADSAASGLTLAILKNDITNNQFNGWRMATEPFPANITDLTIRASYASFTFQDRKGNLWVYRGPHDPNENPSFQVQYYYKTQNGFYFPGVNPLPQVGTITPYLRTEQVATDGNVTYTPNSSDDDRAKGDANNDKFGDGNSLAVTYRPKWPEDVPVLRMAQTLTKPVFGLPAVRGQTSLEILYQQSQAEGSGDVSKKSVILHDPTREKVFELEKAKGAVLHEIPESIKTEIYQGKTYFPNLPPHLVKRFFYDPNRGKNGALVFKGEFVDEVVGEDYLLPNVAGAGDLAALKGLCPDSDSENKSKWDDSILKVDHSDGAFKGGLQADLELFVHNDAKPGTYHSLDNNSEKRSINATVDVTDDDQAVDSYALTASGPGVGYVTLLAGNGLAFTPAGEPVSLHVIKVVPELHPGEIKVIAADNPLNEKLTLQQVVDFAGKPDKFDFEWKISPPDAGQQPQIYLTTSSQLLEDGTWEHVAFPLDSDTDYSEAPALGEVTTQVQTISKLPYYSVVVRSNYPNQLTFSADATTINRLRQGAKITVRLQNGTQIMGTVQKTAEAISDSFNVEFSRRPTPVDVESVFERVVEEMPQSVVYRTFNRPNTDIYKELWLSMNLNEHLGAEVYIDGNRVVGVNLDSDNSVTDSPPESIQNALRYSWRLPASLLSGGTESGPTATKTHRVLVKLYSSALAGAPQNFNLHLHGITVEDQTIVAGSEWKPLKPKKYSDGVRAVIGGEADIKALSDNYITMRYKAKASTNYPAESKQYSLWTEPQLAEGWIKRVLAGINPFHQRAKNLFNNRVDTGVSMLTQAGPRWEGDVALNMDNINDFGLIEIYETVLNRGKMLSIDAGINYGPANDALLLAAGYINDLYMFLGNEARADAANPTIGIGTTDGELGSVATALFAFKGQVPSLLEEELGLLRGRDDFLQPGVRTAPAYNRLFWNYTRGIDAGEVIYALNYNITEDEDQGFDGLVNAEDAQKMYPQGHGDAFGHYLTALKGYYQLLVDEDFTWAPRTEAVLVLGKPVQVDYLDERKFATAAAAVARTGNQVAELTWRRDYKSQEDAGWEHFSSTRYNSSEGTTRRWGVDQWASRTGAGSYLNWVTGNAMLPDEDPNPEHEGIQKIDRQTVPELLELVTIGEDLQVTMDNAEGGLNPLGLDENSIAMDIDPHFLEAGSGTFTFTHFDQVYTRALVAMNNATAAFDDAKGVTEMMRSEENSLNDFQAEVDGEELAYKHTLIELYGTPYPDDIGPGKTYPQGYDGPDLYHHMYVDTPEKTINKWIEPTKNKTFSIDAQPPPWTGDYTKAIKDKEYSVPVDGAIGSIGDKRQDEKLTVKYNLNHHGFFEKPDTYKGKRASPGELQSAISEIILDTNGLREALENHTALKYQLDREIELFEQKIQTHDNVRNIKHALLAAKSVYEGIVAANDIWAEFNKVALKITDNAKELGITAIPKSLIAGLAAGGDMAFAARAGIAAGGYSASIGLETAGLSKEVAFKLFEVLHENSQRWTPFYEIGPKEWKQEQREAIYGLDMSFGNLQMSVFTINEQVQSLDEAKRNYRALVAQGDRIQAEREIFRQRSSAIVQGLRTRDAGFRIFRNEKLERYKTLYDLAARYTYLATKAYDYETGLLHTETGKDFLARIVGARALGLMADGEPQFAGSDTGDPGLSSVLAEMKGDYEVLRGRLGFNNPDTQGTTLSLRLENHRILPGIAGEQNWKDVLHGARRNNLLNDADVMRHCLQINSGNGLPVPGLILEFRTTIEDGYNLFGRPLAGGDSHFSPSNFATKIHGVGIGLENYIGMDVISTNGGSVDGAGGASPSDPNAPWLDPQSLSRTPHVYLIPVGQDIMRSPPLGDASVLRSWNVKDVTIPLPFNVGASEFSARSIWQTKDILSEELFAIRKHQAFRAVLWEAADGGTFSDTAPIYAPSKIVNNRLVGRSVWNTKWKLVIPGKTLLNDPEEGLDRFINSVSDIKVHFETYSYSGN